MPASYPSQLSTARSRSGVKSTAKNEATTHPEKVRLNLELNQQVYHLLQEIQARTGAASITEVLRRSVSLYDLLTEIADEGGNIVLVRPEGTQETLKILF